MTINRKALMRRLNALGRWARDMLVFVVAFWLFSWGVWILMNLAVDAAVAEVDQRERAALDAQGREAWDRYCQSVEDRLRQDDLDAFDPANGECGQTQWEPKGSD